MAEARKTRICAILDMLPPEMVEKILRLLSIKEICQAKLICRRWKEIIVKGNLVKKASGKILVHFLSTRIFHISCFYIYVTLGIIKDLRVHQSFHIFGLYGRFFFTLFSNHFRKSTFLEFSTFFSSKYIFIKHLRS